ncbi:P-selectin glycoprotein ligand 1 [Protopterus annectens]|uniref:P-selectin glycoprotein ligand 1 n=1 Tax=Protopterus annectens TaxID=7888 RepID=UPI001CFB50C5|nr:P-selectin glycoprotein ligand 1 [Protopterus annectens]
MLRSQWTLTLLLACGFRGMSYTAPVMKNTESAGDKQSLSLLQIILGSSILIEEKAKRPWDALDNQIEFKSAPIIQSRKKRGSEGNDTGADNHTIYTPEIKEVTANEITISQNVPKSVNNNTESAPTASSVLTSTSVTEKIFSGNATTAMYSAYSEVPSSVSQAKTTSSSEISVGLPTSSYTELPTASSSNLSAALTSDATNMSTQPNASVTGLWQHASVSVITTSSTKLLDQTTFLTSTSGGNATIVSIVDPVKQPDLNKSLTTVNIKTTKEPDSSRPTVTTTKTISTESSLSGKESRTTSNPGKSETIVGQCLIAIAILAAIATIFIICTIVLAAKLSTSKQNYRVSHQNNTEMVCISTLLPDSDGIPKSKVKPKRLKTFNTNSDDSDGDDLTLNSFLPDH